MDGWERAEINRLTDRVKVLEGLVGELDRRTIGIIRLRPPTDPSSSAEDVHAIVDAARNATKSSA